MTRLQGRAIVCVGFAEWDAELWTNQQHLMSRLACDNDVLFVESLGLRRPQLAARDLRRLVRRLVTGLRGPRRRDGLRVLAPLVLPLHSRPWVRALNAVLLRAQVRLAARRLDGRPLLWAYVPQAEQLLDTLHPETVVYHCVDDIAAQKGVDATSFRAAEERFVARADLVVASAPALAERLRPQARALCFAPNVADTALFATALEPGPTDRALDALPAPRIVFTGAVVATKLDLALLTELARARPGWSFVLVGPVGLGDPSTDVGALAALPNVHLLGGRSYDALPAVLRGADVGIVPYAVNDLTRSVFPMKIYEYLAAGLPVVATPLPALDGVDAVARAAGAAAFAAAVDDALATDTRAARARRSAAARRYSWDARLDELSEAVTAAERTGPPRPATLSADEHRAARLLFADELAEGTVTEEAILAAPEVAAAVADPGVPSLPRRVALGLERKAGRFDAFTCHALPARRARRAVLGEAADGPPRVLLRMDEYPHWLAAREPDRHGDAAFARWRELLAGVPHLVAVVPRLAADPEQRLGPSRELTDLEVARLREMAADGVVFGLHGYEHRTRFRSPHLHTELGHRSPVAVGALLDRARAELADRAGIDPQVLVPPFNTVGARQWPALAARFPVITGGPESTLRLGAPPAPTFRGGAAYLPAHPPLYGDAAGVLPELERHLEARTGLWTPVVLHWGWEAANGWSDLERLVERLRPYATPWGDFLDAVEKSR